MKRMALYEALGIARDTGARWRKDPTFPKLTHKDTDDTYVARCLEWMNARGLPEDVGQRAANNEARQPDLPVLADLKREKLQVDIEAKAVTLEESKRKLIQQGRDQATSEIVAALGKLAARLNGMDLPRKVLLKLDKAIAETAREIDNA